MMDNELEKNRDKKPKKGFPIRQVATGVAVVVMLGLVGVCGKLAWDSLRKPQAPKASTKVIGVDDLFEKKEGSYPLVLDGELSEYRVFEIDGVMYLKRSLVVDRIDCRFYYDKELDAVIYSMADETFIFKTGEKSYKDSKGKSYDMDYAPVVETNNGAYIALDMLNFGRTMCEYYVYEAPKRVSVWTYKEEGKFDNYSLSEKSPLRVDASITKDILIELAAGDKVTVLDDTGEQFYKVKARGVVGYVDKKVLVKNEDRTFVKNEPFSGYKRDKKILIGWAQVTNSAANEGIVKNVKASKGLNVIAPTWYQVSDEEGTMNSYATLSITKELKSMGYEVWPLVSDFITKLDTDKLLSSYEARQKIINYLMSEALLNGYEGYNIDFEDINSDSAEDFLQFLREMSQMCNKLNLVLSVDNYVPMEHTAFYNRNEQGLVADYVITMAYDEHYGGSPEAGSVSSLPFVTSGIANTIDEVKDPNRVIVGLPFYSRIWALTEKDGNKSLKSTAYGITSQLRVLNENNSSRIWNEVLGQYYSEYKIDDTTYMCWVEDTFSLELKLKAAEEAKCAGVAFWRLGLEDESMYDEIEKYIENIKSN